ncbi:hypothetical protein [Bradyrhizobium elkanii]|uniref:hypothetical protein n=1 Tax=Bradyrhizobium elkanii TaxID=29448 RepID=UPI001FD40F63|nr:hypothetical protein [Bradyrhizobium elkanii]
MASAGNSSQTSGRRNARRNAVPSTWRKVPSTRTKIAAAISGRTPSAKAGKANPASTPMISSVGPLGTSLANLAKFVGPVVMSGQQT